MTASPLDLGNLDRPALEAALDERGQKRKDVEENVEREGADHLARINECTLTCQVPLPVARTG